ncbi:MAG: hypothetical protein SFW67_28445 [Myxococcaceae bacterium]|nr:hypothetical protein [Myxococcaceae bacterium]
MIRCTRSTVAVSADRRDSGDVARALWALRLDADMKGSELDTLERLAKALMSANGEHARFVRFTVVSGGVL